MSPLGIFGIAATMALGLLPGSAAAQPGSLKQQLLGTWTFVSSTTKLADGSPLWGANAKGLTIFTDNGCTHTKTAVTITLITASTPVQCRWASFSSRSNINIAQAANPRKISGQA